MPDVTFVQGMRFEKPDENAPQFVKGKIGIKVEELVPWLAKHQNDKGWVNIDLKKSREGKLYLSLNTYQKPTPPKVEEGEADPNEIPF